MITDVGRMVQYLVGGGMTVAETQRTTEAIRQITGESQLPPVFSLYDAVNGITEVARDTVATDHRLDLEELAGRFMFSRL